MTTGLTKFQLQEKVRRLFFKHRGNINAIIDELGLDENYIRKITDKIRRGFKNDTSFEIACFITDAILSGREQRMIILEDRLQEIMKNKKLRSMCCESFVSIHQYEQTSYYKCKKCGTNCEIEMIDEVNDVHVVKLIDRMRKEDELIGKFLATMGIIANPPESITPPSDENLNIKQIQSECLPPVEKRMLDKLSQLDESKITEIRHFVESKINEATSESTNPTNPG